VAGISDRYVARTVIAAAVLVLLAFTALLLVFALLDEFEDRSADYGYQQAIEYVLLTLPRQLYSVLPYAVFLGSLIGLGTLASSSQLVALRAAGVSPLRVFRGVLFAVAGFMVLGYALGEYFAPTGEARAELMKAQARQGGASVTIRRGYWYREGPLFMSVDGLSAEGELRGVRQFWFDGDDQLVRSLTAKRARYSTGADGVEARGWMLYDVLESRLTPDQVEVRTYPQLAWPGAVTPQLLTSSALLEPGKLSISALFAQVDYMEREGLESGVYATALWSKLLQPFAVLALSLLALGFVLGPLRSVSLGTRLATGIFAGLGFKYLQDLFAPMTQVYGVPAPLAVLIPILCCALVGWLAIRRA
ncbi:MAG: LPS export ABC transporter permease LptG, partial [Pseudomonadota bacterium]